ncbi:hypothetical protein [Corallococcus sp. AB049A]|uniref:hypothetical protein n=1 Tax=Corallococcus sp. AB049A TaxID=2316721 RepID=UPI0011C447A2|nr:hypothetical protein [Corallococcus sp. AB049A]
MTHKQANALKILTTIISLVACGPVSNTDDASSSIEASSQTADLTRCRKDANQPAGCAYGDYCLQTAGWCLDVPSPTCSNFAIHGTNWDPSTSTGPVIYEATAVSFAVDDAFCPEPGMLRAKFQIKAYAPEGDLPTSRDGFYNRFHGVTQAGVAYNATAIQNIVTTNNARNIAFNVSLCLPGETTSYTAGFFFAEGNEICVTAP